MRPPSWLRVGALLTAAPAGAAAQAATAPAVPARLLAGISTHSSSSSSISISSTHSSSNPSAGQGSCWGSGVGAAAGLLGLAAAASTSVAVAESVAFPEGPLVVDTGSGKKAALLPTASPDEWRLRLLPAGPLDERPPAAPKLEGLVQVAPPPYSLGALEPHMSLETMELHWGKHHRAYAEAANKQLAQSPDLSEVMSSQGLLGLVKHAWNEGKPLPIMNPAAQVVNHTMFWESMRPGGGPASLPSSPLLGAIDRDFGGLQQLESALREAAMTQFGSGWAWLVCDQHGSLRVFKTSNAVNPLVTGWTPLLCLDTWEHAFYLDQKNNKAAYVDAFLQHLVDWEATASRYEAACSMASWQQ